MSTPADIESEDARAEARRARQEAILTRLTDMGMVIAEAIQREIDGGLVEEPNPTKRLGALNSAANAHARVARAVRLGLALEERLSGGGSAADGSDPYAGVKPGELTVRWLSDDDDDDDIPPLREDPAESVGRHRDREHDDLDALLKRPPAELIALICRDLGVPVETARHFHAAWCEELKVDPASPPPAELAGGGVSSVLANGLASMRTGERSGHTMVEGAGGYDAADFSSA